MQVRHFLSRWIGNKEGMHYMEKAFKI